MGTPVRLQRYLATAGVAARRKAEDLITAGRVKVNGKVVTVLGTKVDPEHDAVLVDDEAVVTLDHFYVLFNKPKGCITAVSDDRGRPTVMDYLPNLPVPVKPVGRLDFYTEGVLLLTNDGELAARLLAPASHIPKTYHIKVHGHLRREDLQALRDGVTLDDGTTTLPAEIEVLPAESKHTWLGITIHEGKHRQIHRMIEALGYRVDKLQRVAFANLTFHNLRVGDARELTQHELNELRDGVGLDHSAAARGRWHTRREETDIPRRARAKARAEAEAGAEAPSIPTTSPARSFASTGSRDSERSSSARSQPGSPRRSQPASPRRSQPGSPRRSQPASPRRSQPGSPRRSQPGSPRRSQPASPRSSPARANHRDIAPAREPRGQRRDGDGAGARRSPASFGPTRPRQTHGQEPRKRSGTRAPQRRSPRR